MIIHVSIFVLEKEAIQRPYIYVLCPPKSHFHFLAMHKANQSLLVMLGRKTFRKFTNFLTQKNRSCGIVLPTGITVAMNWPRKEQESYIIMEIPNITITDEQREFAYHFY